MTREGPDLTLDESGLNVLQDDDSNDIPDTPLTEAAKSRGRAELEEEPEEEEDDVAPPLMGIDTAILYSIDKCGEGFS